MLTFMKFKIRTDHLKADSADHSISAQYSNINSTYLDLNILVLKKVDKIHRHMAGESKQQ